MVSTKALLGSWFWRFVCEGYTLDWVQEYPPVGLWSTIGSWSPYGVVGSWSELILLSLFPSRLVVLAFYWRGHCLSWDLFPNLLLLGQ